MISTFPKFWTIFACCCVMAATAVHGQERDEGREGAASMDTEHIFAFMIGADVGTPGEREFQSATTGRFGRSAGRYRVYGNEAELEFVPAPNVRVEAGASFVGHDIGGVPDLPDRRQFALQGLSLDFRYRFLDRRTAPFGLTVAVGMHGDRTDETTGARVRSYGTEVTLALERDLIPNFALATLNLTYQPEWTRFLDSGEQEREATIGAALGAMVRMGPNFLLGGEARYLRQYEGVGLSEPIGQALFVGPTVYLQLSPGSRLTLAWAVQAWGRAAGSPAALDLVNFERHQARVIFGLNF